MATEAPSVTILSPEQSIYFNGYSIGIGTGDVVATLLRNGAPILTVNMSYTVAKSFGSALSDSVKKLEQATKHDIMTVDTVTKAIQAQP